MSSIFVFSDPHIGHKNVAGYRGFNSAEEHNELIINNWNNVVNKRDTVILLGDLTHEKCNYSWLGGLKGLIKVVLGNHDRGTHVPELMKYVHTVQGSIETKQCLFTHIPIHPCELKWYKYNIHGHIHERTIDDPRYINVSAEVVDYTPVLLNDLIL